MKLWSKSKIWGTNAKIKKKDLLLGSWDGSRVIWKHMPDKNLEQFRSVSLSQDKCSPPTEFMKCSFLSRPMKRRRRFTTTLSGKPVVPNQLYRINRCWPCRGREKFNNLSENKKFFRHNRMSQKITTHIWMYRVGLEHVTLCHCNIRLAILLILEYRVMKEIQLAIEQFS